MKKFYVCAELLTLYIMKMITVFDNILNITFIVSMHPDLNYYGQIIIWSSIK